MPQTIAEKIFSIKSRKTCTKGDIVLAEADFCFATDTNGPTVIEEFKKIEVEQVFDPGKITIFLDHFCPPPNETTARLHQSLRVFSKDYAINLAEMGSGVCHQVNIESGQVVPGRMILGTDSHSLSYGALNAMGIGIGSTDMAVYWATGQLWFTVPESIKVIFTGKLPEYIDGKDLALACLQRLGSSGATYKSVEFTGEATRDITMDSRFTICNMAAEMGAKTCFFQYDELTRRWLQENLKINNCEAVLPDDGVEYCSEIEIDVAKLTPLVAIPHNVEKIRNINNIKNIKVDQVLLGSCTNGRVSDYRKVAGILRGRKIHPEVRVIIFPASRRVYSQICREGILEILIEAGAVLAAPTCGPCAGYHSGIPGDGEVCISTTNRNFKGRMGNQNAEIYLTSPLAAAIAAVEGELVDPVEWLEVNKIALGR